jgi:hypothetical protein
VIADLLLIFLPVRLIRGMSDKRLKRRLYFIFSTSSAYAAPARARLRSPHTVVTTIVSLVHAVYILTDGTASVLLSAVVEDCMSLTVANVPVVATAALRRLTSSSGPASEDDDDESDAAREGTHWTSFRFRSRFPSALSTRAHGASRKPAGSSHWGDAATRGGAHVQLQSQTQSHGLVVADGADARAKHTVNLGSFDSEYRHDVKSATTATATTATVGEMDIVMGPLQSLDEGERYVHGPATSAARYLP